MGGSFLENFWYMDKMNLEENPVKIMKYRRFLLFALLISGVVFLMIRKSYADPLEALHGALPGQIMGWTAEPEDRYFDKETIFDYINGTGEVYRAYNLQRCLSRRYTTPKGPPIVLDIFYMGSSEDAFGVFTHDQDGEALDVGQGALYRSGWLSFWKDRSSSPYTRKRKQPPRKRLSEGWARWWLRSSPPKVPNPGSFRICPLKGFNPTASDTFTTTLY